MNGKVLKHNVQTTHKVYKELELINDKLEAQVCELGQTLKLAEQQVELTSKHVGLVGDFLSIEQSEFMQRSRHTQLEREHEAVKDLLKQVEDELRQYKAQPIDLKEIRQETLNDCTKEELHDWCIFFMRKRDEAIAKLVQAEAQERADQQEQDRLHEQYNKVLGAIDEGLVEDDATLAAASVTEMHATINRLRDENTDLQHRVTRYDAEMRELVRLRGLIGALPLRTEDQIQRLRERMMTGRDSFAFEGGYGEELSNALATLLRERQTI